MGGCCDGVQTLVFPNREGADMEITERERIDLYKRESDEKHASHASEFYYLRTRLDNLFNVMLGGFITVSSVLLVFALGMYGALHELSNDVHDLSSKVSSISQSDPQRTYTIEEFRRDQHEKNQREIASQK